MSKTPFDRETSRSPQLAALLAFDVAQTAGRWYPYSFEGAHHVTRATQPQKKTWFLLFNLVAILYLLLSSALKWNPTSIFSYGLALLLVNAMAWISSRNFKNWK